MTRLLMCVALAAATAGVISPAQAQAPARPVAFPQSPPPVYSGGTYQYYPFNTYQYQYYPFTAPTPDDAYREGLINRWELERLVGPLPQALLGPSVNGIRGSDGGDGRN